jgi:hypothetical protein
MIKKFLIIALSVLFAGNVYAQQAVNGSVNITGPIPWIDATNYGVRQLAYPANTITVTTGVGSPTVTTTGTSDFKTKDGIVIPAAGNTTNQSTPSAPTVTVIGTTTGSSSISYECVGVDKQWGLTAASPAGTTSSAPTVFGVPAVGITSAVRSSNTVTVTTSSTMQFSSGTYHAVIANVTGGTTQFSGLQLVTVTSGTTLTYSQTGANESGTTSSGSYVLFKNAFIVTSVQATAGSDQIVLTTDVNHNIQFRNNGARPIKIFLDGIQFSGAKPQGYADGLFAVNGVTSNTITITTPYTSPITTTGSASATFATSGVAQMTVTIYPIIDVACPAISGTTEYYVVYANYGSGYSPIGFTTWLKNIFEDYGPAFTETGFVPPTAMSLPATPPVSAQNQIFSGQVSSISGNTLTLTGNVPTALTSVTAYHDSGVPLQNALAAACSNGSGGGSNASGFAPVFLPRQALGGEWYIFNAPVDISATCNRSYIVDGGRVYLDGTIYGDNAGIFDWERPEDTTGYENISTGDNSGRQIYIYGHASPEMVGSVSAMRITGMQFNTLSNSQNSLVVQGANTWIKDTAFITIGVLNITSVPLVYDNVTFEQHLTNITWSGDTHIMYPVPQVGSPPIGEVAFWPVPVIDIMGTSMPSAFIMDGINYGVSRGLQMDNLYGNTSTPPTFEISDVGTYQGPWAPLITFYGDGGSTPQRLNLKRTITDSVIQSDIACVASDSGVCVQIYTGDTINTANALFPILTGSPFLNAVEISSVGVSPAQNTNDTFIGTGGTQIYGPWQSVPLTVGSLPAAASGNAGQIRSVGDSTSVSSEGQTCVGGSSNTALAFSNGSVWKCF